MLMALMGSNHQLPGQSQPQAQVPAPGPCGGIPAALLASMMQAGGMGIQQRVDNSNTQQPQNQPSQQVQQQSQQSQQQLQLPQASQPSLQQNQLRLLADLLGGQTQSSSGQQANLRQAPAGASQQQQALPLGLLAAFGQQQQQPPQQQQAGFASINPSGATGSAQQPDFATVLGLIQQQQASPNPSAPNNGTGGGGGAANQQQSDALAALVQMLSSPRPATGFPPAPGGATAATDPGAAIMMALLGARTQMNASAAQPQQSAAPTMPNIPPELLGAILQGLAATGSAPAPPPDQGNWQNPS